MIILGHRQRRITTAHDVSAQLRHFRGHPIDVWRESLLLFISVIGILWNLISFKVIGFVYHHLVLRRYHILESCALTHLVALSLQTCLWLHEFHLLVLLRLKILLELGAIISIISMKLGLLLRMNQ